MYYWNGSLKAKEGKGKELATILLKASELVSNIDGCKLYVICKDDVIEDIIWITEIWDS